MVALGFAGFLAAVQLTGTAAVARIDHCMVGGRGGTSCTGTWQRDGRTVHGTVDGADEGDLFERIAVRVSGARAYKRDWTTMIGLGALGLLFGAATVQIRRGRAGPAP